MISSLPVPPPLEDPEHAYGKPVEPDEGPPPPSTTRKIPAVAAVVGLLVILGAISGYAGYMNATAATAFKIIKPPTLKPGRPATLTWVADADAARYPYTKIEYCSGKLLKKKCTLLAVAAPNTGKAVVRVPASLRAGKGNLKFIARDPKKNLIGAMTGTSGTVTVAVAATSSENTSDSSGGGGGGGSSDGGGGGSSGAAATPTATAAVSSCTVTKQINHQDYDGSTVPTNGDGDGYAYQYTGNGQATISLNSSDAVSGKSLQFSVTSGKWYPQWNPYNSAGNPAYPTGRGFARQYAEEAASWEFNTYNRMSFWVKVATTAPAHLTDGRGNYQFGTYVKCIALPGCPDSSSDEAGGNHWYHHLNIPNWGRWTKVVLNMHPNHQRGGSGSTEWGNQEHPTAEATYNYFDTLTRFYIEDLTAPTAYPATFLLDNFTFYKEPCTENDDQIYSITGTYNSSNNQLLVTWNRRKNENAVNHEVRYAFSNIHDLGWSGATAAPGGTITPPGDTGYNGMVYDTTSISMGGNSTIYIAIKPANSSTFSQIAIPL